MAALAGIVWWHTHTHKLKKPMVEWRTSARKHTAHSLHSLHSLADTYTWEIWWDMISREHEMRLFAMVPFTLLDIFHNIRNVPHAEQTAMASHFIAAGMVNRKCIESSDTSRVNASHIAFFAKSLSAWDFFCCSHSALDVFVYIGVFSVVVVFCNLVFLLIFRLLPLNKFHPNAAGRMTLSSDIAFITIAHHHQQQQCQHQYCAMSNKTNRIQAKTQHFAVRSAKMTKSEDDRSKSKWRKAAIETREHSHFPSSTKPNWEMAPAAAQLTHVPIIIMLVWFLTTQHFSLSTHSKSEELKNLRDLLLVSLNVMPFSQKPKPIRSFWIP